MRFLENCGAIAEVVDDIDAERQVKLGIVQSGAFGRRTDPMKAAGDGSLRLGQHS